MEIKLFLKKISKIALPVLAPLIVLLSIEGFLGMVFSTVKVFYQLHSKYLYVTKADFERAIFNKRTGEKIFFRTSHLGYRGNYSLKKSRPRAVVYGDSNVQALFEREEDTFPVKLQSELEKSGKDFEVINAGTSGYGPDQNLLRLKDDIPVLDPDIIVFQFFADNDFGDLVRNKIFKIEENRLIEKSPKLSFKIKTEYFCAQSYLCRSLYKIARDIKTGNERPEEAEKELLKISAAEYESYQKNNIVEFPMWEDHYDMDLKLEPASDSAQAKVKLMRALVQELAKINAAHPKIKMLAIILPAKKDLWEMNPAPPYTVKILEQEIKRAGLEVLNLYRPYIEEGPQGMYNPYDDHWSPEGQNLAAVLLADKILNRQKSPADSA